MEDDTSSYLPSSSSPPATSSSRYTTPDPSPDGPSFRLHEPERTPYPSDALGSDSSSQHPATVVGADGDLLLFFLLYRFRRYSKPALATQTGKLTKHQRNERLAQQELHNARELARIQCEQVRARADRTERERDTARAEVSELEERVRAIESQLNEVENRYSDSETTLQGVFRLLARTENKRHEIQGQLDEGLLQVGTLQAELARATSELNDERRRNTLLESDLNLARRQAGAAETLRFQNERLQQENQRLGNDASAQRLEITDLQSHIRELKEQAGADAEKVECLDQALRNEKATTTELLSKVSKLKRDSSQAGNELRQLRDRYAKLEEKEADLDRSTCSLENDRDALQQSNDRLQREMTRLQEIIDQTSRRKSQLPRRIGWVRSRGSMPKL